GRPRRPTVRVHESQDRRGAAGRHRLDSTGTAVRAVSVRDDRTARDVGRRARLELLFTRRNGRTVLERGYAEPPLRVGRELQGRETACMILATSSPGLFGGDRFEQRIALGPGACVDLRSQSALQLHPSVEPALATIQSAFTVGEGAMLRCEWDPLIP